MNKAAWQDVKGAMVLAGTYEEAVKMMGDMNFLQVCSGAVGAGWERPWAVLRAGLGWGSPAAHRIAGAGCQLSVLACVQAWPQGTPPPLPALPPTHTAPPPLQSLMNFPKEAINDETVELLQPYFAAPDFNYEAAKKASGNVAGLCNWAHSMCKYHSVAKVHAPLAPSSAAVRRPRLRLPRGQPLTAGRQLPFPPGRATTPLPPPPAAC